MRRVRDNIVLAPTDLGNFLGCRHLASRDLDVANGKVKRPVRFGPVIDELKARGAAHEAAYLEYLEAQGLSIDTPVTDEPASGDGGDATLVAMQRGVDVIYQAVLSNAHWYGRADFLRKVDLPSRLGDWSYEVIDTKLARETKAATILQLCAYSYLLELVQGVRPERMYVVTPGTDYTPEAYRTDDFGAYFRLLERGLEAFLASSAETYPDLVSHCDLCAWWGECEERRRADDHLCYVAGISSGQIATLRSLGITRLAALARLDAVPKPTQGSQEALTKVKEQARVQYQARQAGRPYYELRQPLGPEHGLALLPEPTPDDLFLDFEGNHFAEHGVREYLTGYLGPDGQGGTRYIALWARNEAEEKAAFERFIDEAVAIRERNPNAHIYHFAPYEPAALKRLMGRFATREAELDTLLRADAFVDLYAIVRRAVIAGVERYSIKDLEPLFGYARGQDLHEASMSRRLVEQAIEVGVIDAVVEKHMAIVEAYNREDCESAQRLRDWLERLRAEAVRDGTELPRPQIKTGEASETISDLDRELQRLRDGLLAGVSPETESRPPDEQARFLLAHMMEFHRREEKASWWEFFRLQELEEDDYADERRALGGLEWIGNVEAGKAPLHRYRFPTQELDARKDDLVYDQDGEKVGTVRHVSLSEQVIDIKHSGVSAELRPRGAVLHNHVPAKPLQESLMRLGEHVIRNGLKPTSPYRAGLALLQRRPPAAGRGAALQATSESALDAACRLVVALDGDVLAIQGPPGTGKTYTGAQMICALKSAGLKVGITAVSHKVIINLLEGAMKEAASRGLELRALHKQKGEYEGPWRIEYADKYEKILARLHAGELDVVGATPWAWSRQDFEQSVDVLIVDEAGQMALANVLAVSPAARSLVLLGDPQQLEQPLQSSHPEGSEVSALAHLLDGAKTMPPELGLFLGETYRLHPEIARFTSEVYYENRVSARPELANMAVLAPSGGLPVHGSGLRYLPVLHTGNQARSYEEADAIAKLVERLLADGQWRDKNGQVHPMTARDILIVAPYNAQVGALAEAMPDLKDRIGTVDRFQGQEAALVIYSMTSSSPEDAPRGMAFLYDPHRFNVATSRAMALCVLVGNPKLFEPECRTPAQMRMANGFCRYRELAFEI